jgi:F-type H+-transporting ATPase subunit delta
MGVLTVCVTSARQITEEHNIILLKTLKNTIGKEIKIKATIDHNLIGGLIVKVGSKMIDSSIRSKLENLQNIMKEVR